VKRIVLATLVVIAAVVAFPGRARAYPQFQLAYDQTCSGCHVSPAGGGLLTENGLAVAETISHLGTAPEFFYGKVPTPDWLQLGGDLRASTGFMATPEKVLATFPMQADVYAAARFGSFTLVATGGYKPDEFGKGFESRLWSREHYVMWQQNEGEPTGVFVRAGRFMPVFGLRLAEHPAYIRRFGGTPLYSETYGLSVAYVDPKYEVHVSGFVEDPWFEPVEPRDGGAAYAELRIDEQTAIGGELLYGKSDFDQRIRYGVIAKRYVPQANLLLQAEVQLVNQLIDETPTNPDGGAPLQVVGYLLGTWMINDFVMLDVGLGHFDANVRIRDIDRNGVDVNLRYFMTSHLELALNARVETFGFGDGGPTGGYSLLQVHYRL